MSGSCTVATGGMAVDADVVGIAEGIGFGLQTLGIVLVDVLCECVATFCDTAAVGGI